MEKVKNQEVTTSKTDINISTEQAFQEVGAKILEALLTSNIPANSIHASERGKLLNMLRQFYPNSFYLDYIKKINNANTGKPCCS